jgi:Pyruvate/2-oxoacid:ferredoxin oxidoreductase delta subunit
MVNVNSDISCAGCSACKHICPQKCIEMIFDDEGFLYPLKDTDKCTDCNLCVDVCFLKKERQSTEDYEIYGVKNKNEQIRFESSSGGMFSAIAEYIINAGGVVFGAAYDESLTVTHSYAEDIEGLSRFRKSKYVQSDTKDTYVQAKEFLLDGRKVLYTGCPCQIAGLKSFLGKEFENLICVDLICRGVSSPLVFKSCLEAVEEEMNSKITSLSMREKIIDNIVLKPTTPNSTIKFILSDKRELYQFTGLNKDQNAYLAGFVKDLYNRPSCDECKAKNFTSGSDIQLGDFWGINKVNPNFCDKTEDGKIIPFGVSEVILTSNKGKKLFSDISKNLDYFMFDKNWFKKSKSYANYTILTSPQSADCNRKQFFEEYNKNKSQVNSLIRKYLDKPQKETRCSVNDFGVSIKKLAIFGAGKVGTDVFYAVGKENIRCFIDNNPKTDTLFDIPCLTFDEFLKIKDEVIVIVASFDYANEMCKQLEASMIFDYHVCYRHTLRMFYNNRLKYYSRKIEKSMYYCYFDLIKKYDLGKYNNITLYCYPENTEVLMCVFEMVGITDKIKRVIPYTTIGTEKLLWSEIESQSDCIILAVKRNHSHFHDKIELECEKYDNGTLAVADFYNVDKLKEEFHYPEIKKYKDIYKGKRCFIIGNGPSLRMSDLDMLHKNNEICFATNKIWYAFEDTDWRPDIYVAVDRLIMLHHSKEIKQISAKVKFIADNSPSFWNSEYSENCIKYHILPQLFEPNMPGFSSELDKILFEGFTVTYAAIQLAAYMGFSEIFLLGVDCDYSGDTRKGENHFTKQYVGSNSEFFPHNTYRMQLAYKKAELVSRRNNFRIYNATRGGKLEAFERVDFDNIL